jgi:hypothetical protein
LIGFSSQEFNQHLSVLTDLLANSPAAFGCHSLYPGDAQSWEHFFERQKDLVI